MIFPAFYAQKTNFDLKFGWEIQFIKPPKQQQQQFTFSTVILYDAKQKIYLEKFRKILKTVK